MKRDYIIYIYRIVNVKTGKCYIGKSKNLANRIYSHFVIAKKYLNRYHKFYSEILNSKITDWSFEIKQEIKNPYGITDKKIINILSHDIENFWINYYDSIINGYNHNISSKII